MLGTILVFTIILGIILIVMGIYSIDQQLSQIQNKMNTLNIEVYDFKERYFKRMEAGE